MNRITNISVSFVFEQVNGEYVTFQRVIDSYKITWAHNSTDIYRKFHNDDNWYEVKDGMCHTRYSQNKNSKIYIPKIEIEYQRARMRLEKQPDFSHIVSADDLGLI